MSNTHISNSKWKKGIYKPLNPHKYKGGDAIIFSSRWEYKMMRFLDLNENVLEWISERPLIPYLSGYTNYLELSSRLCYKIKNTVWLCCSNA